MKKHAFLLFFSFLVFFSFLGCDLSSNDNRIQSIEVVKANIPAGYYVGYPNSAFIKLKLHMTELPAGSSINNVYITTPTGDTLTFSVRWALPVGTFFSNNVIDIPYFSKNSSSEVFLPTGVYHIIVTVYDLNSGIDSYTIESNFIVNAPGASTAEGSLFFYNPEDFTPPNSFYKPLPYRASSLSGSKTASNLTVNFASNDALFFDGWIEFFSGATSIGETKTHFKSTNGIVNSYINSGTGILHNNGTVNTAVLAEGDIDFRSGYSFSDITSCRVVVSDLSQTSISVSELLTF